MEDLRRAPAWKTSEAYLTDLEHLRQDASTIFATLLRANLYERVTVEVSTNADMIFFTVPKLDGQDRIDCCLYSDPEIKLNGAGMTLEQIIKHIEE